MNPACQLRDVRFAYRRSRYELQIPWLEVVSGEKVFLHGPSGSGKTTLLGVLAGVLPAQSGVVKILGQDLRLLSGAKRDAFRGEHIGFIFQMFNLIPYLSVAQNICLPCRLHGGRMERLGRRDPAQAASDMAARLGIGELLRERVLDLSVGQQQRVAAARALIGQPELVIADEPTSALDADHRDSFLRLLFENCAQTGCALLFVSHDRSLAPYFDRSISLPQLNAVGGQS
jgi:putative ABC transport system ATP-binding protein